MKYFYNKEHKMSDKQELTVRKGICPECKDKLIQIAYNKDEGSITFYSRCDTYWVISDCK